MTSWTAADIPDQKGRTVLITGANSGLGLRSAEALARAGAQVVLACRNPRKAADALEAVEACATTGAPWVLSLDLADLSSIEAAAETIADRVGHIDVLMNNAGVMAIPLRRTADDFEMQFGTNHLGHFALTGRLLPLLLAAEHPRVITTSSQAHRIGKMRWDDLHWCNRYSKWMAYGQSKLSNLLFTFELDRRAKREGAALLAAAAHPGYASTHLQAAGPEMAGSPLMERVMGFGNHILAQSDAEGALPQLYAATMPELTGGEYYGPNGPFEVRGSPKRVGCTGAARDKSAASRLWEISEKETGVTYTWKPASVAG
jgi:NAD(P)-dependent dehydrogenase (short-subunit alcohol dehydrogenase family)